MSHAGIDPIAVIPTAGWISVIEARPSFEISSARSAAFTPQRRAMDIPPASGDRSVVAAVPAYFRTFTGFSVFDDEGTMMISEHFYLAGFRLYDEVFSAYGPVNYFYYKLIHTFFGVALDHDAVRMTSVVILAACSFLSAWIVIRLTESVLAASVSHLLTFGLLGFFRNGWLSSCSSALSLAFC
jgi:hypothetical protein